MISPVQQKMIDAALAPAKLASDVNAAVAAKSLDAQKMQGAAVLQLLENASPDRLVAPSPTLGATLDIRA